MSTTWIGFRFLNLPEDEQHKFYRALKDAKIVAYELDNLVFAECKGAEGRGNDDETVGDIVPITEIFHRVVDHLGGTVRAHGIRLDDNQVAELERQASTGEKIEFSAVHQKISEDERGLKEAGRRYAATIAGKIDSNQVHARVRREEREVGILREREQET